MKSQRTLLALLLPMYLSAALGQSENPAHPAPLAATAPTVVPALVPYSASALGSDGKPLTGESLITFLLFKDDQGGEPLWTESQNVAIDSVGHYEVQLGASSPSGLPLDTFASGEGRWLEIQIAGQKPAARVLLMSVPYAMKAADAATLGGLPASAYALAGSTAGVARSSGSASPDAGGGVTTPGGTSGYLPTFTSPLVIGNSIVFEKGSDLGIGTTTPATTLDVNGATTLRGQVSLESAGTATATAAQQSRPLAFFANSYNSSSKAATSPVFELKAEPTGNNTAAPGATLNLLYANGGTPGETGLSIKSNGILTFAPGQTFPGSGSGSGGTITGVTAGTGLTGGGTSGNVTLTVNTGQIPTLTGNNTYTGSNVFAPSLYTNLDMNIDNTNKNSGGISPGLRLGQASGEGMASKRTSGGNQYGLDFFTDYYSRMSINAAGWVSIGTGSTFSGDQLQVVSTNGFGGNFTGVSTSSGRASGGLKAFGGATSNTSNNGYGGDGIDAYAGDGGTYGGAGVLGVGGNGSYGGTGVLGFGGSGYDGWGIYGSAGGSTDVAGEFEGNVEIYGTLTADAKDFKIDHPTDPANKYLNHASVESSEMMNIYTGNVTTDELGLATIHLPDWFEAENGDFRYQLTVMGQFAQAIVKNKIANKQFTIMTNTSRVEVSWLITGIRQDAYAMAHPVLVEEAKSTRERGFYKHPELYGQPKEKQTNWALHPDIMQHAQSLRSEGRNPSKQTAPVYSSTTLAKPSR